MKPILLSLAASLLLAGCSTPSERTIGPVVLSSDVSYSSSDEQLLHLHNQVRRSLGLAPLDLDPRLTEYAQNWAETMASQNSMTHSRLTFLPGSGFRSAAENIAFNQGSTTQVTQSWLNSPGHRRNILNRTHRAAGFGLARTAEGRPYWCAVFGGN